jgi:hypothetical protein
MSRGDRREEIFRDDTDRAPVFPHWARPATKPVAKSTPFASCLPLDQRETCPYMTVMNTRSLQVFLVAFQMIALSILVSFAVYSGKIRRDKLAAGRDPIEVRIESVDLGVLGGLLANIPYALYLIILWKRPLAINWESRPMFVFALLSALAMTLSLLLGVIGIYLALKGRSDAKVKKGVSSNNRQ